MYEAILWLSSIYFIYWYYKSSAKLMLLGIKENGSTEIIEARDVSLLGLMLYMLTHIMISEVVH